MLINKTGAVGEYHKNKGIFVILKEVKDLGVRKAKIIVNRFYQRERK